MKPNNYPLALNPFKKGKKTEVEGVRKVDANNISANLEKVLEYYGRLEDERHVEFYKGAVSMMDLPVITSPEISYFMTYIQMNDDIKTANNKGNLFPGRPVSLLLNRLIQESYDAGHNDFVLSNPQIDLPNFAQNLEGTQNNPLNLEVKGNVDDFFGVGSEYCNFLIHGNIGYNSCSPAKNCTLDIRGDFYDEPGSGSIDCHFKLPNVNALTISHIGNVTYTFYGKTGKDINPHNAHHEVTLRFFDKDTYEYYAEGPYFKARPISIQLLDKDEKMLKEVVYK